MTRRAIVAAVVALGLLLGTAQTARADLCPTCFGGWVSNVSSSNGKVIISNGSATRDLWPGQLSRWWSNFRDVDAFWVPGGCDAYSQYGYRYVGNRWYSLPDTAALKLEVDC